MVICTLLKCTDEKNSKAGLLLIKKLIAVFDERSALTLIRTCLELNPLGEGYFNPITHLSSSTEWQNLIESHFETLRQRIPINPKALIVLSKQLMQVNLTEAAYDLLNMHSHRTDFEYWLVKMTAAFWLDKFENVKTAGNAHLNLSADTTIKLRSEFLLLMIRSTIALKDASTAFQFLNKLISANPTHRGIPAAGVQVNLMAGNLKDAFLYYWDQGLQEQLIECGVTPISKGIRDEETCVVYCAMGLGDVVRFSSLMPNVMEQFKKTVLVCDKRLVDIFLRSFPKLKIIPLEGHDLTSLAPVGIRPFVNKKSWNAMLNADCVADSKQFPYFFLNKIEDFSDQKGFLCVDGLIFDKWRKWLTEKSNKQVIGLFWRSSLPSYASGHKKKGLNVWLNVLKGMDVEIIPLQYDLLEEEKILLQNNPQVISMPLDLDLKNDLEEVFALLKALPLIISVPGTLQHMAGAVGVETLSPCHPFEASWRKVKGQTREMWAPSVEVISDHHSSGMERSIELTIKALEKRILDGSLAERI